MVRCLMLDVDGVVVTGRPEDGLSWATDIERDLGIAPDALRDIFFAPHWTDIVTGRKPLLDTLHTCLPALAPSLTAQAFIDYWFEKDSRIDRAVLAACDALRGRGVRVFLATNQEHLRAAHLMDRLALRPHVDGMIYSADIAARKPDRAFFDAAERISGAAPHDILLVDDTKANIDAALAAGWNAAHWAPGTTPETLPDMVRR
ncbi:putative hydrolase of the HAD superfamily [Parvibaculum indicum]|uniref:HAD-IA family hydrolase n=1 Tax=Parvibaculum indicum TaxID=562969 RepID=UPI00141E4425|nr:HAD-IA family hydrolase [Parvibaculum indicum]NIJ42453.1 putative hydrolase of the HAD superfamily [Parvibaculum indicum]